MPTLPRPARADEPPPSPAVPARLASLRPFRHGAFTLLWTAGLVSTIGSWMQTVAVGALVVAHTGEAIWAVLGSRGVAAAARRPRDHRRGAGGVTPPAHWV